MNSLDRVNFAIWLDANIDTDSDSDLSDTDVCDSAAKLKPDFDVELWNSITEAFKNSSPQGQRALLDK